MRQPILGQISEILAYLPPSKISGFLRVKASSPARQCQCARKLFPLILKTHATVQPSVDIYNISNPSTCILWHSDTSIDRFWMLLIVHSRRYIFSDYLSHKSWPQNRKLVKTVKAPHRNRLPIWWQLYLSLASAFRKNGSQLFLNGTALVNLSYPILSMSWSDWENIDQRIQTISPFTINPHMKISYTASLWFIYLLGSGKGMCG